MGHQHAPTVVAGRALTGRKAAAAVVALKDRRCRWLPTQACAQMRGKKGDISERGGNSETHRAGRADCVRSGRVEGRGGCGVVVLVLAVVVVATGAAVAISGAVVSGGGGVGGGGGAGAVVSAEEAAKLSSGSSAVTSAASTSSMRPPRSTSMRWGSLPGTSPTPAVAGSSSGFIPHAQVRRRMKRGRRQEGERRGRGERQRDRERGRRALRRNAACVAERP